MRTSMASLGLMVLSLVCGVHRGAPGQDHGQDPEQLVAQNLLGLVHAAEVHQELKLSPEQVSQLEAFFREVDGDWFRARNLPVDKRRGRIKELEARLEQWIAKNLSAAQRTRLKQLEYRSQGTRMLLRSELIQRLNLSSQQVDQLAQLARASESATAELQKATLSNSPTEALQSAVLQAAQDEQKSVPEIVTPDQLQKLSGLLGEPFDTARLKRIYPMAPELMPVEHWVNSQPLTLAGLRGKVVVVHFYAFQCHNCHANFGHYRKWHEEFGDDVVVLGIQTPETARERDPDAVREAAASAELEFPILVDLESKNWQAWSNTMWPTVYIIDKNGYLRQWWQGELNWAGATGDQQLHQLISDLLQEEAGA